MDDKDYRTWEVEDDVDRLYGRLRSVEPPPNFVAAVMGHVGEAPAASSVDRATARTLTAPVRAPAATIAWLALQLLGVMLVGLAAYWLGHALFTSGAYDLLALLRDDAELVELYPDTYVEALLDTVPWLQLAALALSLAATALTWIYSRSILRLFVEGQSRSHA